MARPRKDKMPDELRLLRLVLDEAPGPRSATVISTSQMAEAMGWSVSKVKILRRSMIDGGLLLVEERCAASGAQVENAYRLTRKGRRLLARMESLECGCDGARSVAAEPRQRRSFQLLGNSDFASRADRSRSLPGKEGESASRKEKEGEEKI